MIKIKKRKTDEKGHFYLACKKNRVPQIFHFLFAKTHTRIRFLLKTNNTLLFPTNIINNKRQQQKANYPLISFNNSN